MQTQSHVGVFTGVLRGLLDRYFAEVKLLLAFARHIFVLQGLVPEILQGQAVHVMARGGAVEHIRLEHGVERDTTELHSAMPQHDYVVLKILADLLWRRALKQWLELAQHVIAIELRRGAGVNMADGHVGTAACAIGERHTDQGCTHGVKVRGLRIDGNEFARVQAT